MENDNPEIWMKRVEDISETIYQQLIHYEKDLASVLTHMRERDACLDRLIPYLEHHQKDKWILVLGMIRDKESAALEPYRAELKRVESALCSLKHCQTYFALNGGEGGMGAGA